MDSDTLQRSQAGTARVLAVELPLPARELCGNGWQPATRGGKVARSKVVREHREAAAQAAWGALRATRPKDESVTGPGGFLASLPFFPAGRVRVDVSLHRAAWWSARALDDDNLWRGLKAYFDGLQDAGVVANDRQFQMGTVTWEKAETAAGGVTLTLRGEGGPES